MQLSRRLRFDRRRSICIALGLWALFFGRGAPTVDAAATSARDETAPRGEDDGAEVTFDAPAKPHASTGAAVKASTEVSGYTDSDAVHVLSPTVAGSVGDSVAGWSVGGSYLVDAVTAASVDIVSTASAHWEEKRHVGAASADFKAGGTAVSLAGGFSREPDYLSIGGGGVLSWELMDKNFMPFLGGSYGHDLVGRHGDPQNTWPVMNKVSVKGGATFVVDSSTIASLSVDGVFERGYLAKPYRYLPIVAPGVSAQLPAGASVDLVRSLNEFSVSENVPRRRDRFAFSGRLAHRWDGATFRGDERFYWDSWGLMASTTDVHVYVDLGRRFVVWPHLRGHAQRGVDFWQRVFEEVPASMGSAPGIPVYRAGDRELGPLYTLTGGFGLRALLGGDVHNPISVSFQADLIYTRYLDALYITRRRALFGALSFEAGFE